MVLSMIIGLTAIFISGCGPTPERADDGANTTPKTTTNSPDSNPALPEGFSGPTKKEELKNL